MTVRRRLLPALLAVFSLLVLVSCDATEIAIDCNDICDRYSECWDKNYDEEKCRANCRDRANEDEKFEEKVDKCAACIEDKACVETFACGLDCTNIVP